MTNFCLELKGRQAAIFRDLFLVISKFNDKTKFVCNSNRILCKSRDKAFFSLVIASFKEDYFSDYQISNPSIISLPWEAVYNYLSQPYVLGIGKSFLCVVRLKCKPSDF